MHDHDHDHLVTKVRCIDIPDSDRGDLSCRCAVNSSSFSRLSLKFQGHTGQKFANFDPNWMFPDKPLFEFTDGDEMMHKA